MSSSVRPPLRASQLVAVIVLVAPGLVVLQTLVQYALARLGRVPLYLPDGNTSLSLSTELALHAFYLLPALIVAGVSTWWRMREQPKWWRSLSVLTIVAAVAWLNWVTELFASFVTHCALGNCL